MIFLAGLAVTVSAQRFGGMMGSAGTAEEVTYSGRIRLTQGEFPTLLVGNERYSLRIDPILAGEISLRDNTPAEVTGVLREFRSFDLLSEERVIHVRAIDVEGTRYVSTGGMHGRHGGMRMHGSSRGRGPADRRGGRW